MLRYAGRTDGRHHRTGRRVVVYVNASRRGVHLELGSFAFGLAR